MRGFAGKSREAAVEGIVLLKNENNTLPLTEQDKVSVFGRPMIEYYRSGTGSGGAVNVEYATNILDGFENSNLNFTSSSLISRSTATVSPVKGAAGTKASNFFSSPRKFPYSFVSSLLYGNGNCYCSTNHWVITHSDKSHHLNVSWN